MIQFGLKDLSELPSLKEFEELSRFALSDSEMPESSIGDPAIDPPTMPVPEQDPPSEPSPIQDPVSDPEPLREPDPEEPGDPQHEPVTMRPSQSET